MKKFLSIPSILILCLLSIGCTPKIVVEPKTLPVAVLGQPYYAEIRIGGGPGPVIERSFYYSIEPTDSGLTLKHMENKKFYNHFKIEGTPTSLGNITVILRGATYGNAIDVGRSFSKTYIIEVKENE